LLRLRRDDEREPVSVNALLAALGEIPHQRRQPPFDRAD